MIRNILRATSCSLAILLFSFSSANAALLLTPDGANYSVTDAGSGYGVTDIVVHVTNNGTFTLDFDNYGVFSENINIVLANSTGSDWASFSINYDGLVQPTFQATLSVLETGSGNPANITSFFTDPIYGIPTGFAADLVSESAYVVIGGGVSDFTSGLDTFMPITISTSAVPVPAAVWLFGSGLLGLVGVARRKKS